MSTWIPPSDLGHPLMPPGPPHHRPPHHRPPHELLGEGIAYVSAQIQELRGEIVALKEYLQARGS